MGHHFGASYIEHTKFRDAILNSTPAEVTLKEGVTSVVTGLAAHKSINEGRVVEIKDDLKKDKFIIDFIETSSGYKFYGVDYWDKKKCCR